MTLKENTSVDIENYHSTYISYVMMSVFLWRFLLIGPIHGNITRKKEKKNKTTTTITNKPNNERKKSKYHKNLSTFKVLVYFKMLPQKNKTNDL